MNKLLTIEDTLTNKISYYHILFFLIALPFNRFYSEVILVSFTLHTFIHLKKSLLKNLFTKEVFILQAVYFITLFGTVYSLNTGQAISNWGRQLVIFLFPIVFSISNFDFHSYRKKLLSGFSFSFTLVILYLYLDAIHVIVYNHLPIASLLSSSFINQNFSEPIDFSATYLSLYIALALNFLLLQLLLSSPSKKQQILYLICLFILSCGLVQLASKTILIAELLIINFIIPVGIFPKIERLKFTAIAWVATTIIAIAIFNIDSLKERYFDEFKSDLTVVQGPEITDSRLERWEVAMNLIKASPVVGYGSGDEVDRLTEKYFENKLYNSYLYRLNAHNQYLSFLIKGGIIGLLVYLSTLLFGLFIAIKKRDILFLCFLILIAMISFSETFLDENKGVFFFSFFFSLFIFSTKAKKQISFSN